MTETSKSIEYFELREELDILILAIEKFDTFEDGNIYSLSKTVLNSAKKTKEQCISDLNDIVKKQIEESERNVEQNNF